MVVSSRTPEGEPFYCIICGRLVVIEPSEPMGDAVCPQCGMLLDRLSDWLSAQLGASVPAGTSLLNEGLADLDSLDTVELAMQLEEAFNVTISEEEAEQVRTVADAIRLLVKKLDGEN